MITEKEFNSYLNSDAILTTEEEAEVFEYYEAHQTKENRNMIIMKNLGLIQKVAYKYSKLNTSAEFEDLVNVGVEGMVRAIDLFDYRKGFKFSTYAVHWVKQNIMRYICDTGTTIRMPVHMHERLNTLRKLQAQYVMENDGKEAPKEWLAKKMKIKTSDIDNLLQCQKQQPVSLYTPIGTESEAYLADLIEDKNTHLEEDIHREYDNELLRKITKDALDEKEYAVIAMRYGLEDGSDYTLQSIGEKYHVSRERIRQIQEKALRKIRIRLIKEGLISRFSLDAHR